jgi:hypothetical protein
MKEEMVQNLETRLENKPNGQTIKLYCKLCNEELSAEFYTWGGAYQFLGVHDCPHFRWVFVGEYFLDPPQDPDTKAIIRKSLSKVNANYGKYFLLPSTS